MPQENMEIARRYYEGFNAQGLDGTEHLRPPQVEAFDPPNFPDADRHSGEAALRKLVESYLEMGWDGRFGDPEYLDAGEEVVVVWQLSGHSAHGGGFPIEGTFAHVCLFEGGKLRRIRQYLSRAEALEAAGLSE